MINRFLFLSSFKSSKTVTTTVLLFIFTSLLLNAPTNHSFVLAVDTPGTTTTTSSSSNNAFQTPTSKIPSKTPSTKMFSFHTSSSSSGSHKIEHISTFAGKIAPVLSKLCITPEKLKNIWSAIRVVTEPADMIFILIIGWLLVPLIQFPYDLKLQQQQKQLSAVASDVVTTKSSSSTTTTTTTTTPRNNINNKMKKASFVDTKLYFYIHLISEAGRIASLVYAIDCLAIALEVLGFNVQQNHISKLFAKTIYTAWIFTRINTFRKYVIARAFGRYNGPDEKRKRRNRSRSQVLNKILDILLWGAFISSLLDVLQIKAGVFINSFFAVGGAGTLVLSFASKDLAMQFVSGFALQASDKVYEGEEVKFGNGVQGIVMKMGLLETLVKHNGELLTAVPNKDLMNQKLTNLSRLKYSQVSQTLRFDYKDVDKMNQIIKEIRNEIVSSCSAFVIIDGSRPFRVYWSNYGESCLEVTIDIRMKIPPIGNKFHECKQEVLFAIHRALQKINVKPVILNTVSNKIPIK